MRMQVNLDSLFARPSSAPIWGGKKGEFRDWTMTPRTHYDIKDLTMAGEYSHCREFKLASDVDVEYTCENSEISMQRVFTKF